MLRSKPLGEFEIKCWLVLGLRKLRAFGRYSCSPVSFMFLDRGRLMPVFASSGELRLSLICKI